MLPAERWKLTPIQLTEQGRDGLKQLLDRLGLVANAYDFRAGVANAADRRLQRRNRLFTRSSIGDGLPLPPPRLVYAVAGHFDLEEYYTSGLFHAGLLRRCLKTNGRDLESFGSLLDFGCGCGRVIRHLHSLPRTRICGADYNVKLVDWCRQSLPFAEFRVNGLSPPLAFEDAAFEFIYSFSVFTHLTEDLQHAWIRELERVLVPGGLLAITTKGHSRVDELDGDERRRFERGDLVVRSARYAGRNLCAAYHPEEYVRSRLAIRLDVVDFLAAQGGHQTQDLFLLRKPDEPSDRR